MEEDMGGSGAVQLSNFTQEEEYRASKSIHRMSAAAFVAGSKMICFYFLASFSLVLKLSLVERVDTQC